MHSRRHSAQPASDSTFFADAHYRSTTHCCGRAGVAPSESSRCNSTRLRVLPQVVTVRSGPVRSSPVTTHELMALPSILSSSSSLLSSPRATQSALRTVGPSLSPLCCTALDNTKQNKTIQIHEYCSSGSFAGASQCQYQLSRLSRNLLSGPEPEPEAPCNLLCSVL